MDVVCLYHADCFDGLGSAWAVQKAFPNAKLHAVDYRDPPPEGLEGKHVIVVDFSYKFDTMLEIAILAEKLTFLDHHEPSEKTCQMLNDANRCMGLNLVARYDANKSGATMAWDEFHEEPCPLILRHIADRDLWRFQLPKTKEIMAGLGVYPLSMHAWNELFDTFQMHTPEGERELIKYLEGAGQVASIKTNNDVDRIIKQTLRYIEIDGDTVPLINVPRSLASEALAKLAQDHPFAVGYYDDAESRVFSLRSCKEKGGRIVNAIAKLFGGDGHPHAAGFTVPRSHELALV